MDSTKHAVESPFARRNLERKKVLAGSRIRPVWIRDAFAKVKEIAAIFLLELSQESLRVALRRYLRCGPAPVTMWDRQFAPRCE